MAEFPIGRVSATVNSAVKAFDIPDHGQGGTRVILRVLSSNGVYVGRNSSVDGTNGYLLNGNEELELTLTVPEGQTASIWVRGVSTTASVVTFIVCHAA